MPRNGLEMHLNPVPEAMLNSLSESILEGKRHQDSGSEGDPTKRVGEELRRLLLRALGSEKEGFRCKSTTGSSAF